MKPAARPASHPRQRRPDSVPVSSFAERAQRLSQSRRSGRRTFGDHPGQPVEEQIRRGGWRRELGRGSRRGRDLAGTTRACQTTREQGGRERVEVDLPRPSSVERLEALGRGEQQRRRLVPTFRSERDARPKEVHLRSLDAVQRSRLRVRSQRECLVERARLVFRLGRGEGARGATSRVERQHGRALQEGGGRGEPAARLRSGRRMLELRGDVLVGHGRRLRPVPGASIRVDVRIGRFREGAMGLAALVGGGCPVHGRARQRMTEHDTGAQVEQAVRSERLRRRLGDPEPLRRAPDEREIAGRIGRGDEQQAPTLGRDARESLARSAPRSERTARTLRATRTHRRAASASCRAAAPAVRADSRASRR